MLEDSDLCIYRKQDMSDSDTGTMDCITNKYVTHASVLLRNTDMYCYGAYGYFTVFYFRCSYSGVHY